MKAIYKFKIELLFVLLFSMSSCSLLDVDPEYVITPDTFYQTEKELVYGITGVYGALTTQELYGNYYSQMISNVDDLSYYARVQNTSAPQWYNHTQSDSYIYDAWIALYAGIKNANEFMEAVDNLDIDKDGKYYAEARFMRAYYHFLLAQAWGDVPLRTKAVTSPAESEIAATSQLEVLTWCADEMKAVLEVFTTNDLALMPSRITRSTVQGILARVYLFLAGESVKGVDNKADLWRQAAEYSMAVISSGDHRLNDDYSNVFTNMIEDKYDHTYYESIWEADFMGNHSAGSWSNGRIGDVIGLVSSSSATNYSEWECNYAYGFYNGSLKLWDLYWDTDRTEEQRANQVEITDDRQNWNMPEYNYAGANAMFDDGTTKVFAKSIEKAPYGYNSQNTFEHPAIAAGKRNCGKYRREVKYEGAMTSKTTYTRVNYPLLRYSDVILMCAEALNEMDEKYLGDAYNLVKQVRDRANVDTRPSSDYASQAAMREFIHNERARELAFESLRKYDLIRWGTLVESVAGLSTWASDDRWFKDTTAEYASATASNIQEKHVYLPIPSIELGVNKKLKQNPLW